jgi:hypothetical protein
MTLIFTLYIGRRRLQSGNDTPLAGGKPAAAAKESIEFSNGKIDRLYRQGGDPLWIVGFVAVGSRSGVLLLAAPSRIHHPNKERQ